MLQKSYIEYPKDTNTPPPPEELREMARELARKRNNHWRSLWVGCALVVMY